MKINFITPKFNTTNAYDKKLNKKYSADKNISYNCYPKNYYITSFRGANINKMYEEYNWYINHDGIPAIKSFLKMNAPQKEMDEFLTHILNTKDRSYQLIDSIVHLPREAVSIMQNLKEKVGFNSQNVMTFYGESPYNKAYTAYIEQKYQNAHNITELLKIRPDWSGKALMDKYKTLTGNENLKIGNLPKQIPPEHWEKIIPYLRKQMEIGLKSKKNIDNLVLDGRTYEFKFFTEGKSSKNVFGVFVPVMMKKYVVKIDSPNNRSLDSAFSLGTVAKIDKYLTSNRSRNSAPLCYYDHEGNFAVYKYIEHALIPEPDLDLPLIKKRLPDFKSLGLDYNDTVGYKNFFKLNRESLDTYCRMDSFEDGIKNNEWISVDNDHVTYSNPLQPSVSKFHKSLPNAMGMFF